MGIKYLDCVAKALCYYKSLAYLNIYHKLYKKHLFHETC